MLSGMRKRDDRGGVSERIGGTGGRDDRRDVEGVALKGSII